MRRHLAARHALRRALPSLLVLACGCRPTPEVALQIRVAPDPKGLYAGIATLDLRAERDGRVVGQHSFAEGSSYLSLSEVPFGPRTVLALDGVTAAGDVIAHGASCPFDFTGPGETASVYFAPNDFFGPTTGAPLTTRTQPLAFTLTDGTVLLMAGRDATGVLASTEQYAPATGLFTSTGITLGEARQAPELAPVNVGALVVGGLDDNGAPIETAEVLLTGMTQFAPPITSPVLGPRAAHKIVALPTGQIIVIGGYAAAPAPGTTIAPLGTTALVSVQSDGTAAVEAGPALEFPRQAHAAVLAIDTVVVIGGYGAPDVDSTARNGDPLFSIEALFVDAHGDPLNWHVIATMQNARAEATATILQDGSILIVGGAGDANGTPRADAEVYNPITQTTTLYPLFDARRGHTATLLDDGRVLVTGGIGSDGNPLATVELFVAGVGFVSERPLGQPRSGHVAIPLCDGTVLVVGGAPGAELYTPSS